MTQQSHDSISIPFARPDISHAEIDAVIEVLQSGILTNGKKQHEFERSFGEFLGNHLLGNNKIHCISVNSCTAGLALALHCLGVGRGDEVITSVLTFTATVEAICTVGATPVLVDIDPDTLNLDLSQVRDRITEKTKAIIPVHFAGLSCDMDELRSLAGERIKIIEDAAHALGSIWNSQKIGSFDFSTTVFSFYPGKPMTTGEGGMVVTQNEKLASMMRSARLHGIARCVNGPSWDYEVAIQGFKCNMNEISAAMGLVQLQRLYSMAERRRQIAQKYNAMFARLEVSGLIRLPPQYLYDRWHSWHLYILQCLAPLERSSILELLNNMGIGTSVHYKPIFAHSYWERTLRLDPVNFPHASRYKKQGFSLPCYSTMTESQVDQVIEHFLLVLETMI
jgi:dTDP-4-amino-4,6-dideoxygalactose transaminase